MASKKEDGDVVKEHTSIAQKEIQPLQAGTGKPPNKTRSTAY